MHPSPIFHGKLIFKVKNDLSNRFWRKYTRFLQLNCIYTHEGSVSHQCISKIKKKNGRAIQGRYFSPCSIRLWGRKLRKCVISLINRKILFLTKTRLFDAKSAKKSKMCQETSYRRKISWGFRICYQNHDISTQSWEIFKTRVWILLTWDSFLLRRSTRYEESNIRNEICTCNRTRK